MCFICLNMRGSICLLQNSAATVARLWGPSSVCLTPPNSLEANLRSLQALCEESNLIHKFTEFPYYGSYVRKNLPKVISKI